MKKMVYLVLCCFYLLQANGANYQVRLVGLDAELNQGNGSFQSDILHYSSGKLLETKFNNLDYGLFTKDDRLVVTGNNQTISLDLGHFKKIFEEQG